MAEFEDRLRSIRARSIVLSFLTYIDDVDGVVVVKLQPRLANLYNIVPMKSFEVKLTTRLDIRMKMLSCVTALPRARKPIGSTSIP